MSVLFQLRLKDDNERLKTRLDGMQNKFGSMAHTKTDLSQQLLMTEEEKLKVRYFTRRGGAYIMDVLPIGRKGREGFELWECCLLGSGCVC